MIRTRRRQRDHAWREGVARGWMFMFDLVRFGPPRGRMIGAGLRHACRGVNAFDVVHS